MHTALTVAWIAFFVIVFAIYATNFREWVHGEDEETE